MNDEEPVPAAESEGNNVYKVTVRRSAGGEDGDADPTDDYDGDDLVEKELTVNVTNKNETGALVISPRQPQLGTTLTPILTDPDNIASPGQGKVAVGQFPLNERHFHLHYGGVQREDLQAA